jgi:hypothetical protein
MNFFFDYFGSKFGTKSHSHLILLFTTGLKHHKNGFNQPTVLALLIITDYVITEFDLMLIHGEKFVLKDFLMSKKKFFVLLQKNEKYNLFQGLWNRICKIFRD